MCQFGNHWTSTSHNVMNRKRCYYVQDILIYWLNVWRRILYTFNPNRVETLMWNLWIWFDIPSNAKPTNHIPKTKYLTHCRNYQREMHRENGHLVLQCKCILSIDWCIEVWQKDMHFFDTATWQHNTKTPMIVKENTDIMTLNYSGDLEYLSIWMLTFTLERRI